MVKCVLLDDEIPGLSYLRMLCQGIAGAEVVKSYSDPLKLLSETDSLDFDVCIMDIEMPGMNGLDLARELKGKGKGIIFTTAYKEFAAEAFDLDAIDYITKPVKPERLEKAFRKIRNTYDIHPQPDFVELNSNKGKLLLKFDEIAVITTSDSDKRDKKVLLTDRQEVILKNISFANLLEMLPGNGFCRINRTAIISLRQVKAYTHDTVITQVQGENGQNLEFPLNEQYRKLFRSKLKI